MQQIKVAMLAIGLLLSFGLFQTVKADAPSGAAMLAGMYKVTASSDPLFPNRPNTDWFLDFGKGVSAGNSSGSVAVSMRQNPSVKVRLLVWQLFGNQNLVVGAQTEEGSRKAVAVANWQIRQESGALVFQRDSYKVVLQPADQFD